MLPVCIIDIIDQYRNELDTLESLPEINAVQDLANRSDNALHYFAIITFVNLDGAEKKDCGLAKLGCPCCSFG